MCSLLSLLPYCGTLNWRMSYICMSVDFCTVAFPFMFVLTTSPELILTSGTFMSSPTCEYPPSLCLLQTARSSDSLSSHVIPSIVEYGMVTLLSVPLHVNISSRYRKLPPSTSSTVTVKLSHSSTGGIVRVNPLRQGSTINQSEQ